jgi:hypothetical protein
MIIGINGPIDELSDAIVLFFESFFFDKTKHSRSKLDCSRLVLDNRWAMVENPDLYLDNMVGSIDGLEVELKTLDTNGKPCLVCLHTNDMLLSGGKDTLSRLKTVSASSKCYIVLSISVPEDITDEALGTEYLVSHVHYGSSNGACFFGMMGPLVIDSKTSASRVRMYVNAQKRTGGPMLVLSVKSAERLQELDKELEFDWNRTIVFGDSGENGPVKFFGLTFPGERILHANRSLEFLKRNPGNCVMSTGIEYKTDMKKFGGRGMEFGLRFVHQNISEDHWKAMHALSLKLLDFTWDPPKLYVKDEESPKWICHICGLIAKLNEQENYTKHGFTYCSIACLSEHRKRGFQ